MQSMSMQKDFHGLTFEAFASGILPLNEHETTNKIFRKRHKNDFEQRMKWCGWLALVNTSLQGSSITDTIYLTEQSFFLLDIPT